MSTCRILAVVMGIVFPSSPDMAQAGGEPTRPEAATGTPASQNAPAEWLVYVGTYTGPQSKGIYLLRFDPASGELKSEGVAAEVANPSFLAVDPACRFLYAAGEISDFGGKKSGAVSALSIEPRSGRLALLNQQPSGGAGPCHVAVDPQGRHVLVANYTSGTVAVLPIREGGRLGEPSARIQHAGAGPNRKRQDGPHAHSVNFDPTGGLVLAADLGADKVFVYRFGSESGSLVPHDPPAFSTVPGGGPRHLALHPNGRFVYVNNELTSSVTAFRWDPDRGLPAVIETRSTLPEGFRGENTTAEVQVHPSGKCLYVSNRGHDSIAAFAIDPETGVLAVVGHEPTQGRTPRNFGVDPTGAWLLAANQNSNSIVVFRVERKTGKLHATGQRVEVPSPVCVRFVPAGR